MPMSPTARRLCVLFAGACALVVLAFAVKVHGRPAPLRIDARGARLVGLRARGHPLVPWRAAVDVQRLGDPIPFAAMIGCLALVAAALRDWLVAVVVLVAPPFADLLTELVGKPLVGRREGPTSTLGFPSGHTTAVAGVAAAVMLLAYRRWGLRGLVVSSGALAFPAAMSAAVVRLRSHFASDAIAGVLLGLGTAAGVAGLLSMAVAAVRETR